MSGEPLDDGEIVEIPRPEPATVPVTPPPATFALLTVADVVDRPSPRWLVRRVIRQGEMVVVYGAPSCGKTFLVLDLVLAIASGSEWWGYGTVQGSALYLAGEGVAGLGKRIVAWGSARAVDVRSLPMQVLPQAVAVIDDAAFQKLGATVAALDPKPAVIVIDTLARYMVGGDENSAQETGVFLDRCAQIAAITGATVLIVHHARKGSDVERGSSAIRGAADVMLEVTHKDGLTTVKGSKAKDAPLLDAIYLTRKVVWPGTDEDGESVTSLVFERGEAPEAATKPGAVALVEPDEEPAEDRGDQLRSVLATTFAGRAAGGVLAKASGLKNTAHYATLKEEIEAGRICTVGEGRYPEYELTPAAPEYVAPTASPSPSSGESSNSLPDSVAVSPTETRESESDSGGLRKEAPDGELELPIRGRRKETSSKHRTASRKKPHPGSEDAS